MHKAIRTPVEFVIRGIGQVMIVKITSAKVASQSKMFVTNEDASELGHGFSPYHAYGHL